MADETANAMSDIEKVKIWAAAKKLKWSHDRGRHSPVFRFHGGGITYFTRRFGKIKILVGQIKMLIKAVKQTFLSEDATMAEDASHSGHAQPNQDGATGSSGNNVNNSTNTGDAYVDEVCIVPASTTGTQVHFVIFVIFIKIKYFPFYCLYFNLLYAESPNFEVFYKFWYNPFFLL